MALVFRRFIIASMPTRFREGHLHDLARAIINPMSGVEKSQRSKARGRVPPNTAFAVKRPVALPLPVRGPVPWGRCRTKTPVAR